MFTITFPTPVALNLLSKDYIVRFFGECIVTVTRFIIKISQRIPINRMKEATKRKAFVFYKTRNVRKNVRTMSKYHHMDIKTRL